MVPTLRHAKSSTTDASETHADRLTRTIKNQDHTERKQEQSVPTAASIQPQKTRFLR